MTETECLQKMVAPGQKRPGKLGGFGGVIQIHVTRACNESCFGCTQGSNLAGKPTFISIDQFRTACESLRDYFGVVGVFGGNPAMHPEFEKLCEVMRGIIPYERRGLWCNNPMSMAKAQAMAATFNPAVSNLNVHLSKAAHELFKAGWPASQPFGLTNDSRHSPTLVAMKDVLRVPCETCKFPHAKYCPECHGVGSTPDSSRIYELAASCDINQHWSAMIGVFRGQLRAWFCEIAGAQSILHQDDVAYPDTGIDIADWPLLKPWWQLAMHSFRTQVQKHCFDCGVPLRRRGELAMAGIKEECSETHKDVCIPKRSGRLVELVTVDDGDHIGKTTDYLGNAKR